MMNPLLCTLIIGLAASGAVPARQTGIEERLRAALVEYRGGYIEQGLLYRLKDSPDRIKTLPYLKAYMTDPSDRVRAGVFFLASGIHTPEAMEILFTMIVEEQSLPYGFVKGLYENYDCGEISGGGERVRDRLVRLSEKGSVLLAGKPMLLLSCFKHDEAVLKFLKEQRQIKSTIKLELGMPNLPIALCADVALSNLGQKDAIARVSLLIDAGETDSFYFLLKAIRFVENKEILAKLVGLAKDKKEIGPVCAHCSEIWRVCDLAVYAFGEQLGVDVGVKPQEGHRYKDDEIRQASERIKAWFQAKFEKKSS